MEVPDTQAYNEMVPIAAVKRFLVQAPGISLKSFQL
jgi:hypothetical protein